MSYAPLQNGVFSLGGLQITGASAAYLPVPTIQMNAGSTPAAFSSSGGGSSANLMVTDSFSKLFGPLLSSPGGLQGGSSSDGVSIQRLWTPSAAFSAQTLTAAANAVTLSLTITSVLTPTGAPTLGSATYVGTVTGGANNALAGYTFTISGFSNATNNGLFLCIASSATSLVLRNSAAVAETHAATAASGTTVYSGAFTGGASNGWAGGTIVIAGFTHSSNNGSFVCLSSTASTITLLNSAGFAETHAGTATIMGNFSLNGLNLGLNIAPVGNPDLSGSAFVTGVNVSMVTSTPLTISSGSSNTGVCAITCENGLSLSSGTGTITMFQLVGLYTESLIGNGLNPDGVYNVTSHINYHCAGMGYTGAHVTGTVTNSYGILMEGPRVPSGTTVTNRYGIFMAPQNQNSGGSNANAWGIFQNTTSERNALGSVNLGGSTGPLMSTGAAAPEGSVTSSVGGLYLRSGGAAGSALYMKETGAGNTGWIPQRNLTINSQSSGSYAILDGDRGKVVTLNNTGSVAVSIAQAGTAGSFAAGWYTYLTNIGTGTVTLTPTTSTINGWPTVVLFQWQSALIWTDGANFFAIVNQISSTDPGSAVPAYLTNDAGTVSARNQIVVRNINTGVNTQRKGLNVYLEHDGATPAVNYDGIHSNVGFTADSHTVTNANQLHTDGAEFVCYASSISTPTNFVLTSVANAGGGSTVYTGTITNGGSNFYVGWQFYITGFTNAVNNGSFICTASSTTTLTLTSTVGTAETHAATAYWMQIQEINALKLRWGTPTANGGNVVNVNGIIQYLPIIQTGTVIANFVGHGIDAPIGGGIIDTYFGVSGGNNFNGITVRNAVALSGFFIDSTVTNSYGVIASAKTASIVADDGNTVARSFIGHGNLQTPAPYALHDGWYGGTGSPESAVSANVGSMFSRQDSTIGDPFYLKVAGTGNTGWCPAGSMAAIVSKSATYSATNADSIINCTGTFTLTLPTTLVVGKILRIKNVGVGTITVSSSVNIDGATTTTLTANQRTTVAWDGTQWWIY